MASGYALAASTRLWQGIATFRSPRDHLRWDTLLGKGRYRGSAALGSTDVSSGLGNPATVEGEPLTTMGRRLGTTLHVASTHGLRRGSLV